jgi:2-oxoglutarate ferredoxin oxidoreductase subunit delta
MSPETTNPRPGPTPKRGTRRRSGTIEIRDDLCKGCVLCVVFCPEDVLVMTHRTNHKGYLLPELIDEPGCTACKICGRICPELAIEVFRFAKNRVG